VRHKSLLGSLDLNGALGREVWSSRECLKMFASSNEWPTGLGKRGGTFIAAPLVGNLSIGVSETRTCSG
jgi:hypothetical protein